MAESGKSDRFSRTGRRRRPGRVVEAFVVFVIFGALVSVGFSLGGMAAPSGSFVYALCLSLGVLTAFRLGLAGVLVEVILLSVFHLFGLIATGGEVSDGGGLVWAPAFVGLFAATTVLVALAAGYRTRSAELAEGKEHMLRKIFHSLPIGIWVRDRSGRTVYLNERWSGFANRSAEEIADCGSTEPPVPLGPNWEARVGSVLNDESGPVLYEPIELVDREGRACSMTLLTARVMIDPLDDFGTLSLLIDETSTRLYESQLRTSERRLRSALNNAAIGFWDEDLVSGKVFADDNWYRILGLDGAVGGNPMETWKSLLHPDDRGRVLAAYEELMQSSDAKTLHIEYRIRKDGEGRYIWVQDRVSVTERQADGKPGRLMGTLHDISERKQRDIDLKLAKERAEAASEAKGHFLATISHEIRTPLNAIIGLSSFLTESDLNEDQKDLAQTIYGSGKSLLLLVNDILDFSKIEAGRLELELQEYPIRLSFEDSIKLFKLRAAEKNVGLTLRLDEALPEYALGDMERLRQIVNNLLANALKFTHSGEVRIQVRPVNLVELPEARRPDAFEPIGYLDQADHEYLEVTVHDTGIGVPKDKQHVLFEAFSQGDPSMTRKYGGTGLGLAICKRLVRAMGGVIWMESDEGEGAEFGFVVRTKFVREGAELAGPEHDPFDPVERIAEQHPCDILVVGPPKATDRLLLSCRKLGYNPHRVTDYRFRDEGHRGWHYDLAFIWIEDEAEALDLARTLRVTAGGKRANPIIGLVPEDRRGVSEDRCKLSGMERVVSIDASPGAVRDLLMDVLLARG